MRFRNIDKWKSPEDQVGLLFFAQRLEELTFEYSLDSHKAPTTNAPFLVHEVLEQISSDRDAESRLKTANHVFEELQVRLQKNIVSKQLITIDTEKYFNFDRTNINEFKKHMSVLRREINPHAYIIRVMELLKKLIPLHKKRDIDFLSRELVTTLINLGMSAKHINQTTVGFFFAGDNYIEDAECLNSFFKIVFPHHHNFTVCFKIKSVVEVLRKENIELFQMEITDELPQSFRGFAAASGFDALADGQKFAVMSDIPAFDIYTAVRRAEDRISRLHDMFRVFHHKESFKLSDETLSEQCCLEGIRKANRSSNRMQYVIDDRPKKAGKKLDFLLKNLNLPGGDDKDKFFRVVEFHGMSVVSDILENQLLNIWISLETITPNNPKLTKIDNVVRGVTPFIGLCYFQRIINQLTFDLIRWNRRAASSILRKIKGARNLGNSDRVLRLVALEENSALLEELFGDLRNFELLRFRMHEMSKIFSSPKKLLDRLEAHQRRVEWQIRRIYRVRNSIVHIGRTPSYTTMLIDNAHGYFDQTFALSCELCCGINGFHNFDECFDYVGWQFEQYARNLKSSETIDSENVELLLWRKANPPDKTGILGS